jgi:acetyltransferase-like isoleucine patch superfamily enzyme
VAKRILKFLLHGFFLLLVLPAAALSGFGRWKLFYGIFANWYALAPGVPGDYLRIAFYRLTLAECSLASRISFGSFFGHAEASIGEGVYIGSYCVLGKTVIGERTQIASGVQILSGRRQHSRDESGRISGSDRGTFAPVVIGPDCWIGAAAIVMADVGAGSTIGAGSVVSRPIPAGSTAVGSPARVIKTAAGEANLEAGASHDA